VELIKNIRRIIIIFLLRRKKSDKKNRTPISLHAAKKIGILFSAENLNNNNVVIEFAQHLKSLQKEVQLLGYISKRDFGFQYPFPLISDKETTWYGKPASEASVIFMRSPFDLMINFSVEECLPLEYITAVSPATFRVGYNKELENANYDLILIPKENNDISNLILNLEKYLK